MEMDEGPDYIIDIPGMRTGEPRQPAGGSLVGRPFIHVRFACCNAYTRIYRNREGTAYAGFCPRCGRKVKARVGPGGTDARWFVAE
jgi:hypothetical protein